MFTDIDSLLSDSVDDDDDDDDDDVDEEVSDVSLDDPELLE